MRESWKEWIPDALLMISRKKKRKYISRLKDHCKTGVFCNDYVELTPLTSSGLQDFHNICMSTFFLTLYVHTCNSITVEGTSYPPPPLDLDRQVTRFDFIHSLDMYTFVNLLSFPFNLPILHCLK